MMPCHVVTHCHLLLHDPCVLPSVGMGVDLHAGTGLVGGWLSGVLVSLRLYS